MNDLALRFREQAGHCMALGSPFMARLCNLLADRLVPGTPLTDRLFGWEGDIGPGGASVPLRLCGGLHALRLLGRDPLVAVYPPHTPDDTALWSAVEVALRDDAAFLDRWIDSPPQTNEVRRSAVLIAAGHWLTARYGLPLVLSEIGASGGLNLMWDRFSLQTGIELFGPKNASVTLAPDWSGTSPVQAEVRIAARAGVDLNPLDPSNADDRLRLLAYLWADQSDRLLRTSAAIEAFDATVDRADGIDWLRSRLETGSGTGRCHMVWSTIAWQYFPKEAQARGTALFEEAGRQARDNSPLAWFTMENDGSGKGAALTLRLWPGNLVLDFGRADFHGRWVDWQAPAP